MGAVLGSGFILLVVGCALGGLVATAGLGAPLAELRNPLTMGIIRFTVWQAGLSAFISVLLAIPLARALARRRHFPGRRLLLSLGSVAFIIPSLVAVLGIVAVYGRQGWLNQLLAGFGLGQFEGLYGLGGILIAHVFFNLPLATRIFVNALSGIPQHSWDLARLYGMRPWHIFRRIELPLLRRLLPGVFGMVFLLCFTSFAIVLTLGGGPKSTTLEVAIYQAVRLDFDLARAVALSLIQLGLCLLLGVGVFFRSTAFPWGAADYPGQHRPDCDPKLPRFLDVLVIVCAMLFLGAPLLAVLVKALVSDGWGILQRHGFWAALGGSLRIAPVAGLLACALAVSVCSLMVTLRHSNRFANWALGAEAIGWLTLLLPPITLGTGLFLFFHRVLGHGDPLSMGLGLVILLNALLTTAFAVRILAPALLNLRARYDPLCALLGIAGMARWRWVLWQSMRRPLSFALAITTALSLGDMGVIALFGTEQLTTLPLLMYRLIGAYRLEEAAVVAVVLCGLCFVLFWLIEWLGGRGATGNLGHESAPQSH